MWTIGRYMTGEEFRSYQKTDSNGANENEYA